MYRNITLLHVNPETGEMIADFAGGDSVVIQTTNSSIPSKPPQGMFRVTNLYVNPATGKLVVEYNDQS